jgi:glycosyltransferase involved in cell wall biosynthesis
MHILVVEGSGRGFLCQYSHALALGLHRAGEQVTLLTGERDELADWAVPFDKRACLGTGLAGWWCLARQVRELAPDLVHLQWIGHPLAALLFLRWSRAHGIAVVYTPHNVLPHERRWLSLPLFRALYRRVDRVIARDRHLGWALEELLDTPQERLAYLPGSPNPLALDEFPSSICPELTECESAPDKLRMLFFGHGSARKGLDGFLQVLAARDWPDHLHLVVAGEGVLTGIEDKLLAAARARLRISVVDRYLRPQEVKSLFSQGDLLVMPYRKRCRSPLTDLAAAFGVPVLRSDRVQGTRFREGTQGLTYPHDRPEQLGDLIMDLARNLAALDALRAARESVQIAMGRLAEGHRRLYREVRSDTGPIPVEPGATARPLARGL